MTFTEWVRMQRSVGTSLIFLEVEGDARLVQASTSYISYGMPMNNPPIFFIWAGDKLYKRTSNYKDAYKIWNTELCCKAL